MEVGTHWRIKRNIEKQRLPERNVNENSNKG